MPLNEKPRPGASKKSGVKGGAYVIASAGSRPPAARNCWTMQMIADKLVQLKYMEPITAETVRCCLKKGSQTLAAPAVVSVQSRCRLYLPDGGYSGAVCRSFGVSISHRLLGQNVASIVGTYSSTPAHTSRKAQVRGL